MSSGLYSRYPAVILSEPGSSSGTISSAVILIVDIDVGSRVACAGLVELNNINPMLILNHRWLRAR